MDPFLQGYIECALWLMLDDKGEPVVADVDDLSPEALATIKADCADFQTAHAMLLEQAGSESRNGHDFFLTRNGHGAGFWDRGYGRVGDELTKWAKVHGSQDLYFGDDGKIHVT